MRMVPLITLTVALAWPDTTFAVFNDDGDTVMNTVGPSFAPRTEAQIRSAVDSVIVDTRVGAMVVNINAQVMYYATSVGTRRGTNNSAEDIATWDTRGAASIEAVEDLIDQSKDAYEIMVDQIHTRGGMAIMSFRMNDVHTNKYLESDFWRNNPSYRISAGRALNFGETEVRDHIRALIAEAFQRYDWDGMELDFNRTPPFFSTGTQGQRLTWMLDLVTDVHDDFLAEEIAKGRDLTFAVRAPSNLDSFPSPGAPTPTTAKDTYAVDVEAYYLAGLLDYMVLSSFTSQQPHASSSWRSVLGGLPLFCGVEIRLDGSYVSTAWAVKNAPGCSGVYLFNFRGHQNQAPYEDPPFEDLALIGLEVR